MANQENFTEPIKLNNCDPRTEELESTFELLKQYSVVNLLQRDPTMLNISKLTPQVTRELLKEGNNKDTLWKLLELFEIGLEPNNLDLAISTWHYANAYWNIFGTFYMLPSNIVQMLCDCGRYEEAYSFVIEQLKVMESLNHPRPSIHLRYKIGNVLLKQKRFLEAMGMYEDSTGDYEDVNLFLRFAAKDGNLEATKFIIENKGTDDTAYQSKSLLHCAIQGDNLEVVRFFVEEKGMGVNMDEVYNVIPIQYASELGNLDIVKFLIEKGADCSYIDGNYMTSVHYAAKQSNPSIIEALVEKGADLRKSDVYLKTPLHYAVKKGHFDVVKYLIEKGADVNFADISGKTPLHQAACMGNLNTVRFLIKKGSNVGAIDRERMTPLDYAFEKFDPLEIIDCRGSTQLHYAAYFGNVKLVQNLLKRVGDDKLEAFILHRTKGGNMALDLAIKANNKTIIKILDLALQKAPYTGI